MKEWKDRPLCVAVTHVSVRFQTWPVLEWKNERMEGPSPLRSRNGSDSVVVQIRSRETRARVTIAVSIGRVLISLIPFIGDPHPAAVGVETAAAGVSGRNHAIEHVNAKPHAVDQVTRLSKSWRTPWTRLPPTWKPPTRSSDSVGSPIACRLMPPTSLSRPARETHTAPGARASCRRPYRWTRRSRPSVRRGNAEWRRSGPLPNPTPSAVSDAVTQ